MKQAHSLENEPNPMVMTLVHLHGHHKRISNIKSPTSHVVLGIKIATHASEVTY